MKNLKKLSIYALTFLYAGSAWSAELTPVFGDKKFAEAAATATGISVGGAVGLWAGMMSAVVVKKYSPVYPVGGAVLGIAAGTSLGVAYGAEAVPSELDLKPQDLSTLQDGQDLKNE